MTATGEYRPAVRAGGGIAVSVVDAVKRFGDVAAVNGVSLEIAAGEFVSLLGPSGCGKSTLLRLMAGLETVSGGAVRLGGARGEPGEIAFVFQDAHLLPWRDVVGNVALPLELMGVPRGQRREIAESAVERVGLADAARRRPGELSGGMRMRASLARALVTGPRLLLLDEPFAALDEITRGRLDDMLRGLWESAGGGMTVCFVTHAIAEAAYLSDRAVVFSARPARVVLDHRLALPAHRTPELRTDVQFAREGARLFDALRDGGEGE